MTEAYCIRCRTKKTMKNEKAVTMENGKPATRGMCPDCGSVLFRVGTPPTEKETRNSEAAVWQALAETLEDERDKWEWMFNELLHNHRYYTRKRMGVISGRLDAIRCDIEAEWYAGEDDHLRGENHGYIDSYLGEPER